LYVPFVYYSYIYTGTFETKKLNYDFAWEILYAAKKFSMPDSVIAHLHSYFRKEVLRHDDGSYYEKKKKTIKRVWPTIERAVEYADEELLEVTWQVENYLFYFTDPFYITCKLKL
jgi:hypothetical protein